MGTAPAGLTCPLMVTVCVFASTMSMRAACARRDLDRHSGRGIPSPGVIRRDVIFLRPRGGGAVRGSRIRNQETRADVVLSRRQPEDPILAEIVRGPRAGRRELLLPVDILELQQLRRRGGLRLAVFVQNGSRRCRARGG